MEYKTFDPDHVLWMKKLLCQTDTSTQRQKYACMQLPMRTEKATLNYAFIVFQMHDLICLIMVSSSLEQLQGL